MNIKNIDKERLKQWLIENKYMDASSNINDINIDKLSKVIEDNYYTIIHTPIRKKYLNVDEYIAPKLIPMEFKILDIDNFVIVDTETTGLYRNDEVIEFSVLDIYGNELYHSLFKPQKKMGEEAIRITGVDNPMLENCPLFKDEWPSIVKAIGNKRILGHNIKFDYRITLATAKRYNISEVEVKNVFLDMIDSLDIFKRYIKSKSYKLAYLSKLFNINEVQKHRATYDCLLTLQVLRALESRLLNEKYNKENIIIEKKKAIIYGYLCGKSIEDLSIFYNVSENQIGDIILEKYHNDKDIDLSINSDTKEKILFVYNALEDKSFNSVYNMCNKFAKEYEVKFVLAKI